jgi:hypothetical protein
VSGSDVFDSIFFVNDDGHVVRETWRKARSKKRENTDRGADFHKADLKLADSN